ncbi:MAG: radical SAM protein, partial [bacterium]
MPSTKKLLRQSSSSHKSHILFLHPRVYVKKYGDHMLIFNPDAGTGVLFLPYFLKTIYNRINGKRTVDQIVNGFVGGREKALLFLDLLERHYIVSTDKTPTEYFPRPLPKELKVWLHITNACNFDCPYCFIKKTAVHMSIEILQQSIDRIMQQAHQLSIPSVLFIIAGGEPLLRKNEILYAVRQAKQLGRKIGVKSSFCIISNGSLLTDEFAEELKKEGVILSISIDTWFEKTRATRILGNGTNALPSIKKGVDIALRHHIFQAISITITKDNIAFLPQTLSFFLNTCPTIDIHFNMYFKPPTQKTDMKGDDKKIIEGMKKTYRL